MKKSIRYVAALIMLVAMLVPATAYGAENPFCKDYIRAGLLQINKTQIQNMYSKYMLDSKHGINMQALINDCIKNGNMQSIKICKPDNSMPAAPQKPAVPEPAKKPSVSEKPAAPPETQKSAPSETTQKPAAPTVNKAAGSYEAQVADLVNQERAAQGLPALKYNAELSKVAEAKAADLRDKNYFSHTSPTYGSPFDMMKSFGIRYTAAGENIAKGYTTPAAVMNGWMNSPGHKANILNSSFTEIGVGYVSGDNGAGYWVQMFIRP